MTEPLLTRYRMLRSGDGENWTLCGSQDAHNGDAAVKKFFGLVEDGMQVVAVTERSWRPLVRKKQVVERFVNAPIEEDLATPEPDQLPLSPDPEEVRHLPVDDGTLDPAGVL